jgi:undecaprenyl-diphosphatase
VNRLKIKQAIRGWTGIFLAATRHPIARKAEERFPGLFRWIVLRFDPHHFRGLPFTVLCMGVLLNMLVLSELAEEVIEISQLRKLDLAIVDFFHEYRSEQFAGWIFAFTRLCSSPAVLAIAGMLTFFAVWRRRFHALVAILAALAASSITAFLGKIYYRIPRPVNEAWYEEFSWSFPSGHATVAVAYYGVLFYLLVHHVHSQSLKRLIRSLAIGFILLMGFSRIYLCVHYLSDVLAGYAIGLLWFLFSVSLLSWLDFRKDIRGV